MEYFSHLNDKVVINGETFNLDHFKKIEPNYTLPEGAIGVVYKPNQRNKRSPTSRFKYDSKLLL